MCPVQCSMETLHVNESRTNYYIYTIHVLVNIYSLFGCLSERKAPGYQKEVCLYEFLSKTNRG